MPPLPLFFPKLRLPGQVPPLVEDHPPALLLLYLFQIARLLRRSAGHVGDAAPSTQSLADVGAAASEISRRWGALCEIQPADFLGASEAADIGRGWNE